MPGNCTICAKSVGFVEERKACKKLYHVDCFKCGGINSDGCGKKLTLDNYTAHADEPYCKSCYSKNFGPAGFRGTSSSINSYDKVESSDHVNDQRETRQIDREHLPEGGGVKAAMAALKSQLPDADK